MNRGYDVIRLPEVACRRGLRTLKIAEGHAAVGVPFTRAGRRPAQSAFTKRWNTGPSGVITRSE